MSDLRPSREADERARIAEETLEIYAPLAGRMGMHDMREEMEEIEEIHTGNHPFPFPFLFYPLIVPVRGMWSRSDHDARG